MGGLEMFMVVTIAVVPIGLQLLSPYILLGRMRAIVSIEGPGTVSTGVLIANIVGKSIL